MSANRYAPCYTNPFLLLIACLMVGIASPGVSGQQTPSVRIEGDDATCEGYMPLPRPNTSSQRLNELLALSYTKYVEHDFAGTRLAGKYSIIGRIQRVERWIPLIRAVEAKYDVPEDWITAIVMHESYGDPVQENSGLDGGIGLGHMQGPTAKRWGLRIHGTSYQESDSRHGKRLNRLARACNRDIGELWKYDDRWHLIKNLDAVGRIFRQGMDRARRQGKSGNELLRAGLDNYRGARLARTRYRYRVSVTKLYYAWNNAQQQRAAARDFNRRNQGRRHGRIYNEYIADFYEMNRNWGLQEYKTIPALPIPR